MTENGPNVVLLLNMGGPDSEAAVAPFLTNLFLDPEILPLPLPGPLRSFVARRIAAGRAPKVIPRYRLLGGKSPQGELTARQATALEAALNAGGGGRWRVLVAMRYWHPFIEEAVEEAAALRPARLVALSLYPHYSRAVGGSSIGELHRALRLRPVGCRVSVVDQFFRHPLFLQAHAARIAAALAQFAGGGRDAFVLFSAHNLPEKLIRRGDPYLDQVRATVEGLLPAIGARPWELAFQSRSGPVKWLAPEVAETLRELAAAGRRQVLMVPLSFVSDQIETLYEIDLLYAQEAQRAGVEFRRTPAFNDAPDFIALLEALVRQAAGR
ncbi:MAG TPA: ferrochelatase [bacterium]